MFTCECPSPTLDKRRLVVTAAWQAEAMQDVPGHVKVREIERRLSSRLLEEVSLQVTNIGPTHSAASLVAEARNLAAQDVGGVRCRARLFPLTSFAGQDLAVPDPECLETSVGLLRSDEEAIVPVLWPWVGVFL